MLENFIYSKTRALFEAQLNAGNVLDEAIVFIEDTKEIWNHGTYFDCSTVDISNLATKAEIPTKTSQLTNDSGYITSVSAAGTSLGTVKSGGDVTISGGVITVNDDSHAHIMSNIDGLEAALAGKASTSVASTTAAGLMSKDDKSKLDTVAANANNYSHPIYTSKSSGLYKVTVDGTGHISATAAVAKSDITALGIPAQDTTYSAASSSANGLMTSTDKKRIDFMHTGTTRTTLASIPTSGAIIHATLSGATSISLASSPTMTVGQSITVVCTPSATFTQPLPTSGAWVSMDGDSLSVTSGKVFEINILCYASGKYSISCKTSA